MADADRTPIIVAIIGLTGVVATALFANWDKIVSHPAAPAAQSAPAVVVAAAPASTTAQQASALAAAQNRVVQPEVDALNGVANQIDAANPATKIDGAWRDSDGYRFQFIQKGRAYTFRQFKGAALVGGGKGVLDGRAFSHDFSAEDVGRGHCTGQIAEDGATASGQCQGSDGHGWSFTINR